MAAAAGHTMEMGIATRTYAWHGQCVALDVISNARRQLHLRVTLRGIICSAVKSWGGYCERGILTLATCAIINIDNVSNNLCIVYDPGVYFENISSLVQSRPGYMAPSTLCSPLSSDAESLGRGPAQQSLSPVKIQARDKQCCAAPIKNFLLFREMFEQKPA